MHSEVPLSSNNESLPALSMDLLESDSVIDLLEASSNDDMFYLSDDVPLFNPTSISQCTLPPSNSLDLRDIVRQDALIGSYFQNSLSNPDTDASYVTQYTSSTLSNMSAVDKVFQAPFQCDSTNTTQHVFAKPVRPPPSRATKTLQKPNPSPNQYVVSNLISKPKHIVKNVNIRGQASKSRSSSSKTTRTSKAGSHSHAKPPARVSVARNSKQANRSKPHNFILISRADGASSSSTGSVKSKTVRQTVTSSVETVTESALSFTNVNNPYTEPMTPVSDADAAFDSLFNFITGADNFNTSDVKPCPVSSTITSQTTATNDAVSATTVPMQSTSVVPFYPSPKIVERPPSPLGVKRCVKTTLTSKRDVNKSTIIQTTKSTAQSSTKLVTATTLCTTTTLISHTSAKSKVCAPMRATPNSPLVTFAHRSSPTISPVVTHKPYAVVPTRSTCALPPGAALYAPTTTPSARTSRLRAVPATKPCQTFTIDNGMGSYTTLTISPDIVQNATPAQNSMITTQSAISATNTSAVVSDTAVRPRSQLLIPIASTSTGISYLMTSTISSLPEVTQAPSSAAAVSTPTATMRPDASNRTRTRLILPSMTQNVSRSMVDLSSTIESKRTRNTLAIISPQIPPALDTSGTTGMSTIRAFAIAKPQSAGFLSSNTETIKMSLNTPAIKTEPSSGVANTDNLSSIKALLTSDLPSSSLKTSESGARPLSRIYMPFIHGTNTKIPVTTGSTSINVTTRVLTPSSYILTSGMGTAANSETLTPKQSQRVVIPLVSPTVTTATACTSRPVTTDYMSSITATADIYSRLRNRLLVPTDSASINKDCANSDIASSSITTYTITRNRALLSSLPLQSGLSRSSESFNPMSSAATHNMLATNVANISFPTTTASLMVASTSESSLSPSVTSSDLPSSTPLLTTVSPTLTSNAHRYVIKFTTTQSVCAIGAGTVTAANMTPITTSTLSPIEHHQFLEPRTDSRLRTFPSPRTYSVAQRNVPRYEQNVSPRPTQTKRIITSPSPLQIFPEIVCPQTSSNLPTILATQNQPSHRFALTHSPGSSTLVVPPYKNTVFKNLSTIAHPMPSAMRLIPNTQTGERLILKRPVTCVRRTFPIVAPPRVATAPTGSIQRPRFTSADYRSHLSPEAPQSPDSTVNSFDNSTPLRDPTRHSEH